MNTKQYKTILLVLIGILIFGFGFCNRANAEGPSIYISPTNLNKTVGDTFDISVKVNPNGQKVCVVEGKLVLNKLSCEKVEMGSDINGQTLPSCNDLSFLLGIQECTATDKIMFTVTVKAESSGSATAGFTGVDIIGEGVSISSTSSDGSYTIVPSCICDTWGVWQDGVCGGESCSLVQRLQTRTRLCTPSGCENESEHQCKDDSSCVPQISATELDVVSPIITLIGSSIINLYVGDIYEDAGATALDDVDKDITENIVVINPVDTGIVGTYIITYNVSDSADNPAEEVIRTINVKKKEEIVDVNETLPKGLLATLSMAMGEISKSALFTIVTILCLIGLAAIGGREWWLFRKRKKFID